MSFALRAFHRVLHGSHVVITQPLPANKFGPGDVVAMRQQQVEYIPEFQLRIVGGCTPTAVNHSPCRCCVCVLLLTV